MGGFAFAKSEGLGRGASFYVCVPHITDCAIIQKHLVIGKILASEEKTSPFSSSENLFKQATQSSVEPNSLILFAEVWIEGDYIH
jgi:hypothetical protein